MQTACRLQQAAGFEYDQTGRMHVEQASLVQTYCIAQLPLTPGREVPTLPTLATSRFAASKMKMTPCLLELAVISSCSAEGGARPPTMLLLLPECLRVYNAS